ncbi:MAG: tyrosine-type recombinase/integrase [Candidatus Woesearchaeota archaeon]
MNNCLKKQKEIETKFNILKENIQNKRDYLIFNLIFLFNQNSSKIINLKKKDIKIIKNEITINKHKEKITEKKLLTILKELITNKNNEDYLFENNQNKKLSKRRIEQIFKELSIKTKIKITPHKLKLLKTQLIILNSKNKIIKIKKQNNIKKIDSINYTNLKINERDFLIYSIIKNTGCKTSQITEIKKKDITKNKIFIRFKDSKIEFNIDKNTINLIKKYSKNKKDDEYLFSNKKNKKLTKRRVQQIFNEISKKLNQKITCNSLRKNYIITNYLNGENIEKIKNKIGLKRIDLFTHGIIEI